MLGAIDIGGTKIALGIVDENGKILLESEFATALVMHDPQSGIQKMIEFFSNSSYAVKGIGIGCTGPVYTETGSLGIISFLPGWSGLNIVAALQEHFDIPIALDNDANAAAMGEWAWGAGKDTRNFIMVTVGTGIGVGMVLNGQLYHGGYGGHEEMGHHVILAQGGPQCFCGASGCWESLASGTALQKWAAENDPNQRQLTGKELCQLAESGDAFAKKAVERTARFLAIGVANLVTLLLPDKICLGGGLMNAWHLFEPAIHEIIAQHCGLVPYRNVEIVQSVFKGKMGLVGAAQLCKNHLNK